MAMLKQSGGSNIRAVSRAETVPQQVHDILTPFMHAYGIIVSYGIGAADTSCGCLVIPRGGSPGDPLSALLWDGIFNSKLPQMRRTQFCGSIASRTSFDALGRSFVLVAYV